MKFLSVFTLAVMASSAAAAAIAEPEANAAIEVPDSSDFADMNAAFFAHLAEEAQENADLQDDMDLQERDIAATAATMPACVTNCAKKVAPQVGCKAAKKACICAKKSAIAKKIGSCIISKCSAAQIKQAEAAQKAAGSKCIL